MTARTSDWSSVSDLIDKLERRWRNGALLTSYARGESFDPIKIAARTPSAADLIERTADVQAWATRFRSAAASLPGVVVVDKTVRSRSVGENTIPAAIHIAAFADLAAALGKQADVAALDAALETTAAAMPEALDWVCAHPHEVVEFAAVWPRVAAAVRWVTDNDITELDLRHIDAPAVDSKFLVEHRKIVRPLLDHVLPGEQVDRAHHELDKRYGFRTRPTYVRLRSLGNNLGVIAPHFTEVELRVDQLAQQTLPVASVYVVENRATFNSFPDVEDSVVIFGGGYAASSLGPIHWLNGKRLIYWGDIDTHGFRILNRLRGLFPHCTSILMDTETLEANIDSVVVEPSPLTDDLEALNATEALVYRSLCEDRYGPAVRLEQERIPLTTLRQQLRSDGSSSA